MAQTSADISNQIRTTLRLLDPDIATEPLTPERKIIDTVADVIAESEVDAFVQTYQYDIDTKVGSDLDKFVALFGFARQGGRAATGTVTFSRTSNATTDLLIPAGTQVVKPASSVANAVVFQTTVAATIFINTTSVDIPVECTVMGEIGNVAANSITAMNNTGAVGVSSISNTTPTSGGTSPENDDELRVRFKNTIFRNIAGTQDQFLALAIASRFANKANVIGPISRFIEYLQITSGAATSIIPYSKYTYPFDYWLTDGNFVNERFYNPTADFTFASTVPPSITVVNSTNLPNSSIVLLEHTYTSKNSRNNPSTGVTNYVDVYVSGHDYSSATESAVFPSTATNLSATTSSVYYNQNFIRVTTNAFPTVGNRFQPLLWQPSTGLPTTITIGTHTYTVGTHYNLIRDVTLSKGSRRANNGIEWIAGGAGFATTDIAAGTAFAITYTFDKLPLTLNELMEAHKQIATDVLVHGALERFFRIALTIMYSAGYSRTAVDAAITTTLTDFLERQQFGAVIQVSDILEAAHEVPGVDNVRLTTSVENGTIYGIQELSADGSTILSTVATDFTIQDSDLPVLYSITTLPKSQNTWSTF